MKAAAKAAVKTRRIESVIIVALLPLLDKRCRFAMVPAAPELQPLAAGTFAHRPALLIRALPEFAGAEGARKLVSCEQWGIAADVAFRS